MDTGSRGGRGGAEKREGGLVRRAEAERIAGKKSTRVQCSPEGEKPGGETYNVV